jgi:voltage-gated potassium channel
VRSGTEADFSHGTIMALLFHHDSRFARWRAENRTTYLLVSLVVTILAFPYLADLRRGVIFVAGFMSFVLVTAALAVSDNPRHTRIGLALAIPSVALRWGPAILRTRPFPALTHLVETAFLVFTTWVVLRYVLSTGRITRDKLFGAGTVYLLIATIFANVYAIMEWIHPGSFRLTEQANALTQRMELGYFSLVTLTTLGYGDVTPLTPRARSVVVLEAFTGVMYMATLVARLVSLYSSDPPKEGS